MISPNESYARLEPYAKGIRNYFTIIAAFWPILLMILMFTFQIEYWIALWIAVSMIAFSVNYLIHLSHEATMSVAIDPIEKKIHRCHQPRKFFKEPTDEIIAYDTITRITLKHSFGLARLLDLRTVTITSYKTISKATTFDTTTVRWIRGAKKKVALLNEMLVT